MKGGKAVAVLVGLLVIVGVVGFLAWMVVPNRLFAPTDSTVPDATYEQEPTAANRVMGIEVVVENLEVPWALEWLPDGTMLVTERPGRLLAFVDGQRQEIAIPGTVLQRGEGGLLGLELHPDFAQNRFLYLYRTTNAGQGTVNTVERYRLTEDLQLTEQQMILSSIPGAVYHDGGRMEFGPDGLLYITTGDAQQEALAQDTSSLAGKILRVADDGSIPDDNPFGNAVYSYGHRNPQGLAWDESGQLWATEHGRSGIQSGLDELNRIEAGENYGWPTIEGDETQEGMQTPVIHSGTSDTWAPASLAFWKGSLFFGGLRGEALYEAALPDNGMTPRLQTHLREEFGRLREVTVGPDDFLYVTTSNQDGRGEVRPGDDKILKIPASFLFGGQ